MPLFSKGIMSELTIVAISLSIAHYEVQSTRANLTHSDQAASSYACEGAHEVEKDYIRSKAAAETSDQKSYSRYKKADAATQDVREAAVKRLKRGARDQI
jgi:Mg-chelatase subunit ChlI